MESRPYHNSSAIQFHCFRYACEKYDNTTLFHRKSHFWRRKSRDTLLFANDANQSFNSTLTVKDIAREQAFRGALGVGRERKETLQNYFSGIWIFASRKSMRDADWRRWHYWWRHYLLWHVFFNVCLHSRSLLFRADWQKSDNSVDGEPQGSWRLNWNSKDVVTSSPSFSLPAARAPRRACSQAIKVTEDFSEALTEILKQASPHRTMMDVGKSSIRYCSTTCKI